MAEKPSFVSNRNACKLCTPLGACMAFRGIKGAIPLTHGSQGCATYIRRYIISHFKEPMDVASSNFSEEAAIFGGGANLKIALENVTAQYNPSLIGIATTCLSETIGDDVPQYIRQYQEEHGNEKIPAIMHVSTPSYRGTHMDGFHAVVRETVKAIAGGGHKQRQINLFPGFVSPADMRYLKEIMIDFDLKYVLLPDYSETLDAPIWAEYEKMAGGGTSLEEIKATGRSRGTIEFGRTNRDVETAGKWLWERFRVPDYILGLPIGVHETDLFFHVLEEISGLPTPPKYEMERGRLIDSYVDAHKYVFQKRAIVYGEEDLVIGLASFLAEIGITPVICASGGKSGLLKKCLSSVVPGLISEITVYDDADFMDMDEKAESLSPDLVIGNSKGYFLARKLGIPLVRVGFPIHDRIGGQRLLHLGYRGAQRLFDEITNTLLREKQEKSEVGYSYM